MSTPTAPAGPGRPRTGSGVPSSGPARPSAPRGGSLAVAAAIAAGMVVPVQARLNGELSHRLDDGIAAAAISFSGGLVLLSLLALFSPGLRGALGRLAGAARDGRLPRRYLLAGVLGGTFALAQSTAALVTGIAVFTVSAIAGQTFGGLIVDARGIGGGLRQRPGATRITGAAVILVAAVVSALPQFTDAPAPAEIILPALAAIAAGFLLGVQQSLNGASTAASGSPLAATWLNFFVGAAFLVVAWGAKTLVRGVSGHALPTSWWVYLGGLCGVVFIGASAFLVRRIGVLLLSMASIAGQLAGSIALDFLVPSGGRSPSVLTVLGALLTFAAVWIASRRPRLRG
ncbi:transporter family-2 protein [Streptomyces sp. SAI-135]|uniref:DMT family transporter n=1 Tax=unclassified Streptomyces TaxID=2593676 RepID=UPI0024760B12|nr:MULTISPECIES: DMT family transporter [unclassified Streptomyces]MDH6522666.1 transporter family-2 protein [Streptomyces sp. SAI-090]MDH6554287.1 transporter family-2 protein [Streptomyces sp. SAI-041]MDH6573549.1 transporter family-2 protein [Streptomyces sp. SAI-117]MDH6581714.1 transporter family-2 protein [Streptomyces sp. SAI-133]MDH6613718.1 transporter family-2 protein [Streptomyces sp. SAI-135]